LKKYVIKLSEAGARREGVPSHLVTPKTASSTGCWNYLNQQKYLLILKRRSQTTLNAAVGCVQYNSMKFIDRYVKQLEQFKGTSY